MQSSSSSLQIARHDLYAWVSQYLFQDADSGNDLKQHLCGTTCVDIVLNNIPELIKRDTHMHSGEMKVDKSQLPTPPALLSRCSCCSQWVGLSIYSHWDLRQWLSQWWCAMEPLPLDRRFLWFSFSALCCLTQPSSLAVLASFTLSSSVSQHDTDIEKK